MGKTNKQLRKLWPERVNTPTIKRCMFVDPGVANSGGTGWAFFEELGLDSLSPFAPDDFGVIRGSSRNWCDRAGHITREFDKICNDNELDLHPLYLFIEFPVVWVNSFKSMTSTQKGELFKLSYLCGALAAGSGYELCTTLFSVNDWKGQLPKAAVISRIKKQWPELGKIRDHEADAIGMGLAFQGGL